MQLYSQIKKPYLLLIIALVMVAVLSLLYFKPAPPVADGNLLKADAWAKIAWQKHGEAEFDPEVRHEDSGPSVRIHTLTENDISFAQTVSVTKGRYYRFSSWINTSEVEGKGGANLSVLGGFNPSKVSLQGNTPWTYVEQVFHAEQDAEAKFALRLGYYGSNSKGTAWFASPRLEELSSWAGDSILIQAKADGENEAQQTAEKDKKLSTLPLRLFILLLLIPFALLYAYLVRHRRLDYRPVSLSGESLPPLLRLPAFWLLIVVALCVRLAMIRYPGFTIDTLLYTQWALDMAQPGRFLGIYPSNPKDYFIDYPPLYLYVLGLMGLTGRALSLDYASPLMVVLIKTPPVLMDLVISGVMLSYCRRRFGGPLPWVLASLFAFNPMVIFDSAFWGQTDITYCAIVLASLLLMERQRIVVAGMALAVSFALKPQAMVFIIFYIAFVFRYYPVRTVLLSGLASVAAFVLAILPFAYNRPLLWIVDLYSNTAEGYAYLSVNAYNFWAMLGLNWAKADTPGLFGLSLSSWSVIVPVVALAVVIGVIFIGPRRREVIPGEYGIKDGKTVACRWQPESLFPAFYLVAFAFFVFFPRMHERYLFPILLFMLPMLPVALRMQWTYLCATLLLFANLAYIFVLYIYLDEIPPADNWVVRSISSGIVLMFVLSLIYELQVRSERVSQLLSRIGGQLSQIKDGLLKLPLSTVASLRSAMPTVPEKAFVMARLDYLALCLIFLLSLSLLLFRIGDINYPTHPYKIPAEPVVLEVVFDPATTISQFDIYDGIYDGKLTAEYMAQGKWKPLFNDKENVLELNEFYKIRENKLVYPGNIERIRLRLEGENAEILELGFFGPEGQLRSPSKLILNETNGQRTINPRDHLLFDEPASLRFGGDYYMRSTYFDEIYHGRTALEFLRKLEPYENTHPPLGKVLIGLGIKAFDMTPFGWRFVGAVFGAAMVLLMFFGGRLLTKRRSGAYLAATLITFEFMNFTLSRYSTIDVILTFFITASYLSLYKWYSLGNGRLVTGSARWLILAGICVGCAIATKWIGLYAGFANFLFMVWLTLRELGSAAGKSWGGYCRDFQQFWNEHVLRLGSFAILGFALIPLLIYWSSYGPFLESVAGSPPLYSVAGAKQIIEYQGNMLDYHANISAEGHPYQSSFYSWPVIGQPLWLSIDTSRAPLRSSISLMGNPAIWWPGLAVLLILLWRSTGRITRETQFVVGAYLALYIPWVSVERMTFIYHYYPCVPFMILAISLFASHLDVTRKPGKALLGAYFGVVVALFILFYAAISGLPITDAAAGRLHWFSSWGIL